MMIRSRKKIVAFLMVFLWLFAGHWAIAGETTSLTPGDLSPGNQTFQVAVNGLTRKYLVHIPPEYSVNKKWPVVIMFHGGGGTAKGAMWETGWAEKADKENFLAVFPEGNPPDPSRPGRFLDNPQTWNDGSKRPSVGAVDREVADMEFVSKMLSDLDIRFKVDKSRIYVTGFSNGASMSFRLARELSSSIAAAAPVAGADWLDQEKPGRLVPLLYITGTADPLNPFTGGEIRIGLKTYGKKPATPKMIGKWIAMLDCKPEPQAVYNQDGAKGTAYGCPGKDEEVVLYILEGHGHHWPGGQSALPEILAEKNTAKLKATDVIWAFFKKHSIVDAHTILKNPEKGDEPRR
jgi:polyhydroxybutyrate depolymerase